MSAICLFALMKNAIVCKEENDKSRMDEWSTLMSVNSINKKKHVWLLDEEGFAFSPTT